jgi:hypothetical protein
MSIERRQLLPSHSEKQAFLIMKTYLTPNFMMIQCLTILLRKRSTVTVDRRTEIRIEFLASLKQCEAKKALHIQTQVAIHLQN